MSQTIFAVFLPLAVLLPAAAFAQECNELRTEAEQSLERGRRCESDAECVSVKLSCPFACAVPMSKNSLPQALNLAHRYGVICGNCEGTATPCAPKAEGLVCYKTRCWFKADLAEAGIKP